MLESSPIRSSCCCGRLSPLDAPALLRLHTDRQVRQFLGGPVAEPAAHQRVQLLIATDRPLPAWAIRSAKSENGPLLGFVSLDQHHDGKDIEVSFALLPEHQGQGLATEAVQFALRHAFDDMGLARVVAETQSLNTRSIALLHRIGMVLERKVIRFGAEQSIYATLNPKRSASP